MKSIKLLEEYLNSKSKDELQKHWDEIESIGFGGPTIEEILPENKIELRKKKLKRINDK